MEVTNNAAKSRKQISALARYYACEPEYVVQASADSHVCAAKWRLPAHRVTARCTVDHILHYHTAGAVSVSKVVNGKTVGGRAVPGSIFFIPRDEHAEWTVSEDIAVMQIYLAPTLIERFAEENDQTATRTTIAPIFGTEDPWLKGYFQMLISEAEVYGSASCDLDSLLLTQAQQILIRHLMRWYSGSPRENGGHEAKVNHALRPFLLRRVIEYIDARLSGDIHLSDLAKLVHLSENHFIRAFHAATGTTPYQFVLEKRLQVCAHLLRADPRSIAEIATHMGFKSPSYFSAKFRAHYGLTPTRYRQTNRSTSTVTFP